MIISRSVLLIMRNVSDKFVEKIKANICVQQIFFLKSSPLRDSLRKYDRARQAANHSMAQVRCMLDNCFFKYTQSQYVILIAFPLQQ